MPHTMTRRPKGSRWVAVLLGTVVLGAGCSGRSDQALTAGSAAPVASPTAVAAPDEGAGRPLSQAEAQAALLAASDVGPGWGVAEESPSPTGDSSDEVTTASDPACQRFVDTLSSVESTWGLGEPATKAEASYSENTGEAFSFSEVGVSIESYPSPIDTGVFEDLSASFEKCNRFTSTDSSGVTSTVEIFPVALPNYGDATFAMRLQITQGVFMVIAEIASVAIGHNLLTVSVIGLGGIDLDLAPRLMEASVSRLEQTVGQ